MRQVAQQFTFQSYADIQVLQIKEITWRIIGLFEDFFQDNHSNSSGWSPLSVDTYFSQLIRNLFAIVSAATAQS